MHRDDEVICKIPQYTRLLAGVFLAKHGHNPFNGIESGVWITSNNPTCAWLLKDKSHRAYLFNLIRHLLKEYDKRFGNAKFMQQRAVMEEISSWSKMDSIDWSGTTLEHESKMVSH